MRGGEKALRDGFGRTGLPIGFVVVPEDGLAFRDGGMLGVPWQVTL